MSHRKARSSDGIRFESAFVAFALIAGFGFALAYRLIGVG